MSRTSAGASSAVISARCTAADAPCCIAWMKLSCHSRGMSSRQRALRATAFRCVRLAVDLVPALIQLSLAAAAYMLLGVGIGALARSPFVAIGVVLGYFLFVEYALMMIPGVNAIYPFLPGGATASLTSFDFLTGAIASQTALTPATIVSPVVGAATLVLCAVIAAILAVFVPLRRDLR